MMLEELLELEARELEDELADHDVEDFTRRLAIRLAQAQSNPSPRTTRPVADERAKRSPLPARPVARRGLRRRPTPIVQDDPKMSSSLTFAEVRHLCETVLRSDDLDRLSDFAADYDAAGARTFACLLYTLHKRESALYWWRFAAGAEDELAAHLLAMHHAAVGYAPQARLWRAVARLLGFSPARHLPREVHKETDTPAHGLAHSVLRGSDVSRFLHEQHLPGELVTS
ncbi:hypothetical protein ABZ832_28400 [Streptantibioticus parmotrematis]|uniref:hypothetical protein n=1 Tax=Streptantibioticus parmotrematis TaxID=2873249 RepID=UPI0033FAE1A7